MKVFHAAFLCAVFAVVSCEPPVPQNQYLPPQQQQQPSNNYLPPSSAYGAPSQQPQQSYQQPSRSYGAPSAPSSNYGAPAVTSAIFPSRPQSSYGAPSQQSGGYSQGGGGYSSGGGSGGYGNNEENYGPAKYSFEYNVQDYGSGQDFGHMESREGEKTVGRYYVLLPDGRKQIVNYEADEHGYRPTITYEQTNSGYNSNAQSGGYGGYDNNAQNKFNGY